jgi:hypothetical protein
MSQTCRIISGRKKATDIMAATIFKTALNSLNLSLNNSLVNLHRSSVKIVYSAFCAFVVSVSTSSAMFMIDSAIAG